MSNIIQDQETIFCPICNQTMKQITYKHLKKHSLTVAEFKIQYPNDYLIHPDVEKRVKKARLEGKRNKEKVLVEKPCWNFQNCNNKMMVNINVSNPYVTCNECRSKNMFHPSLLKEKKRMSEQAKKLNKNQDVIKKRGEAWKKRTKEDKEKTRVKREKTMLQRYGPDWKNIQLSKTHETMKKVYGAKTPLEIEEFKKKMKETKNKKKEI